MPLSDTILTSGGIIEIAYKFFIDVVPSTFGHAVHQPGEFVTLHYRKYDSNERLRSVTCYVSVESASPGNQKDL
jgi:hypothetical protein